MLRTFGSIHAENGLAADAALQQGIKRPGGFVPRRFEFDLIVHDEEPLAICVSARVGPSPGRWWIKASPRDPLAALEAVGWNMHGGNSSTTTLFLRSMAGLVTTCARASAADNLDLEQVTASYDSGVLRLSIPVAEKAKPRKIEVSTGAKEPAAIGS